MAVKKICTFTEIKKITRVIWDLIDFNKMQKTSQVDVDPNSPEFREQKMVNSQSSICQVQVDNSLKSSVYIKCHTSKRYT